VSAWPTIPALLALLLLAAECTGRLSSRTPRTPNWPAWCWNGALVSSYVTVLAGLSPFMRVWQLNIVRPLVVIASLAVALVPRAKIPETRRVPGQAP
jgi:hypothetical protein